jgi:hypothetical protein
MLQRPGDGEWQAGRVRLAVLVSEEAFSAETASGDA